MISSRFFHLSVPLLMACAVIPGTVNAQSQGAIQPNQSVAEAARQNRAQKKNLVRHARVISDDDLDREYFRSGREGLNVGAAPTLQTEAPGAGAVAAAEAADEATIAATEAPVSSANETKQDIEIAELKAQIAGAEIDLDLQRREFALDQDTVYSNPNYTDSHAGKRKLDAEQQRISQKQQEIEGLKARLAVLQEHQEGGRHASESSPHP
jgi:hypothetical protein